MLHHQLNLQLKFLKSQTADENVKYSVEIAERGMFAHYVHLNSEWFYHWNCLILNFISSISGSSLLWGKSTKLQMSEDHEDQRKWVYRSSTCMVRHVPPMNLGIKPTDLVEVFGGFNCKIEFRSCEKRIFTAAKLEDKDGMEREAFIFCSDVFFVCFMEIHWSKSVVLSYRSYTYMFH